jgi:hypothetical protein
VRCRATTGAAGSQARRSGQGAHAAAQHNRPRSHGRSRTTRPAARKPRLARLAATAAENRSRKLSLTVTAGRAAPPAPARSQCSPAHAPESHRHRRSASRSHADCAAPTLANDPISTRCRPSASGTSAQATTSCASTRTKYRALATSAVSSAASAPRHVSNPAHLSPTAANPSQLRKIIRK